MILKLKLLKAYDIMLNSTYINDTYHITYISYYTNRTNIFSIENYR